MTNEPEFPGKVRVGYKTYRIEDWAPRDAATAQKYGEAAHLEGVIRIDRSHGPVQEGETMLHELLHAVSQVNHRLEDLFQDVERAVTGLSAGMTQVMRDNPAVRERLCWCWTQED